MDRSKKSHLRSVPDVELPLIQTGRKGWALAYSLVMLLALAPMLALGGFHSTWVPQVLLATLVGLSVLGTESSLWVNRRYKMDATGVLYVIGFVFLGPMSAFCMEAGQRASYLLKGETRVATIPHGFASAGWGAVLGTAVFGLFRVSADDSSLHLVLAVTVASLAFWWTDYLIGAAWVVLHDGVRPWPMLEDELIGYAPLVLVLSFAAGLLAAAYAALGPLMLPLVLPVIFLPLVRWPHLKIRRPPAEQKAAELCQEYAEELAVYLRLPRNQRRMLRDAARLRFHNPRVSNIDKLGDTMNTVLLAFAEPEIESKTIEASILRVADRWARLTAENYEALPQAEALIRLRSDAAFDLDPEVVGAADRIADTGRLAEKLPERKVLQRAPQIA